MIFQINGYSFPANECVVTIERQRVRSDNRTSIEFDLERWTVEGEIIENTANAATLIAAYRAREAAVAREGGDAYLKYNDGAIAHQLLSRESYSGVRISTPFSYPQGGGQEFVNSRSYRFVIEAEKIPDSSTVGEIVYFEESLTFEGGGREIAVVPLLTGPVDIQTIYEQTETLCVQEGVIVGRTRRPPIPAPLFGGFEWRRRRRIRKRSPEVRSLSPLRYTNYRTEYSYTFLSPSGLDGEPNRQTS